MHLYKVLCYNINYNFDRLFMEIFYKIYNGICKEILWELDSGLFPGICSKVPRISSSRAYIKVSFGTFSGDYSMK